MNGSSSLRGSLPLMIAKAGVWIGPTSAWPAPGPSCDRARATQPPMRLPRHVVASEHEAGWRGIPTQQFSRRITLMRRKLPALIGTVCPTLLKIGICAWVVTVAQLWLSPFGRQSGLSRRSTSILPSSGSTLTVA